MRKEVFSSFPDEFIIFDTEFTAWENSIATNWGEPFEKRELVQIGGLKIKKEKHELKIIEKISIYLKPIINPVLSDYFVYLTGITQTKIEKEGLSFINAMSRFYDFSKDNDDSFIKLYSYGNDFNVMEENLRFHKLPKTSKYDKWGKQFYDISSTFAHYINISAYSSGALYQAFDIKPDMPVEIHNALWDSTSLFLSLNTLMFGEKKGDVYSESGKTKV